MPRHARSPPFRTGLGDFGLAVSADRGGRRQIQQHPPGTCSANGVSPAATQGDYTNPGHRTAGAAARTALSRSDHLCPTPPTHGPSHGDQRCQGYHRQVPEGNRRHAVTRRRPESRPATTVNPNKAVMTASNRTRQIPGRSPGRPSPMTSPAMTATTGKAWQTARTQAASTANFAAATTGLIRSGHSATHLPHRGRTCARRSPRSRTGDHHPCRARTLQPQGRPTAHHEPGHRQDPRQTGP